MATNNSSEDTTAEQATQFCGALPDAAYGAVFYIIIMNSLVGVCGNAIIFISYCFFKTRKKLSSTEYFISLLSLADFTFSLSVLLFGTLSKLLPPEIAQRCGLFYKIQGCLHAFEQFLSWLLYLNISFERFLSICKPVLHRATYSKERVVWMMVALASVAVLLTAPMVRINCEDLYNYIFGYYTILRVLLALTNICSMSFTYYNISKQLHKLHLKRVLLMSGPVPSQSKQPSRAINSKKPKGPANPAKDHPTSLAVDTDPVSRDSRIVAKKEEISSEVNAIQKSQIEAERFKPMKSKQLKTDESEAGPSKLSNQSDSTVKFLPDTNDATVNYPAFMRERKRRRQEKRMTIVMFSATVCFTVLVLPQCIGGFLEYFGGDWWMVAQRNCFLWWENISVCMFNVHFSINFFIYLVVNTSFRKRVQRLMKFKLSEEESETEGKMLQMSGENDADSIRNRRKISSNVNNSINNNHKNSNNNNALQLSSNRKTSALATSVL